MLVRSNLGSNTWMAVRNVSALALYNDHKEILLQHRSKDAPRLPDYWGFFGGGIEREESPDQALAREIDEELEYMVRSAQLIFIQKFTHEHEENTKYVFIEKYNSANPLVQQRLIPLTQVRLYVVGSAVPHPCGDCPVL